MHSDPIADLLTRIRNATMAGHRYVEMPLSKAKVEVVKVLQQEGYIKSYEIKEQSDKPYQLLRVEIKYDKEGFPVIRKITRYSKPGLRKYSKVVNLPRVIRGAGVAIVSTNKGLLTDRAARREGVGGEILCFVE